VARDAERNHRLRAAGSRCRAICSQLRAAAELRDAGAVVYFVDEHDGRVSLSSKPVEVGPMLRQHLFGKRETVVCTSATLCGDAGSFQFLRRQLGVPDEAAELQVGSPFDHSRCLVVVPEMPEANSRDFARSAGRLLVDVVRQAGGRTLALFTSWRVLEVAHRELIGARLPFAVLRQGEAPRAYLLRRFAEDESSVLLGVESFWAGVDVPGRACSVVFMDKLPFPHGDDPVMSAVMEANPDGWFFDESLPRAVVQFRQGFGRLLRRETDYGVVVCGDRRITAKPYGRRFLRALPAGVVFGEDVAEVGPFLAEHVDSLPGETRAAVR
jgi:ATP-dependent DNA helicase DinG